ncbi:unnamed protein product, partial [Leptidea sinapis]
MAEVTPFYVDRAKGARASCKGCKGNCPGGELRIAKVVPSPYGENQTMKSWHHIDCLMNALLKQRPTTKRIESINDIGNWANITKEDQEYVLRKINEMEKIYADKHSGNYSAKVIKNESLPLSKKIEPSEILTDSAVRVTLTEDNKFNMFCLLCDKISKVDAYTEKTAAVNRFFTKGCDGKKFQGDLILWCKMLLPQVSKRVYNLKSKQLVKLFSRILNTDHDDMLTHLEQGDVSETIETFFSKSRAVQPASGSTLTIHDINNFLDDLSKLTKEEEQIYHFKKIVKKCTLSDLKMMIRLIKGDLRINAGPKHILEGVHPDAYQVFQTSRDLNMVIDRVLSTSTGVKHKDSTQETVQAKLSLMTPVLPMLAEACKSVEMAMKKCPNDAQVCLYIFDCLYYNGEVLIDVPIRKRRKILHDNMVEVKNHVMFSEQQLIKKPSDLASMIAKVLQLGLEGLVLKDLESTYEPGKRHWLKVKKDYLFDGAMADTADLVVLGAWFGTGRKGGMMSVFLMGCHDQRRNKWLTVTKVHTGHDDSSLDRLQKELTPLMMKISQDYNKVPPWLECNRGMVPDFIALDPKNQPVWEITGTELTKANQHTADGISVRFPRVTRIRNDKDWKTATNLEELKHLYKTSKEKTDVTLLNKLAAISDNNEPPTKKIKASPSKIKGSLDAFVVRNKSSSEEHSNIDVKDEIDITPNKKKSKKCESNTSMDVKDEKDITPKQKKKKESKINSNIDLDTERIDKIKIENQTYPENPLPDIFKDLRLGFYPDFISIPEEERRIFERHWIAYGGEVVKSIKQMDVDYVLHNDSEIEFRKMERLKKKLTDN